VRGAAGKAAPTEVDMVAFLGIGTLSIVAILIAVASYCWNDVRNGN